MLETTRAAEEGKTFRGPRPQPSVDKHDPIHRVPGQPSAEYGDKLNLRVDRTIC